MKTFLSVCRTLNYTRSAAELNITQPAVSQHIAFLESSYGAKLVARQGKRLSLTPAGVLLRDAAATMAHDEDVLRDAVAALSGPRRSLRIGMTLTAGEYVLAEPLAHYLAAHPQVQVRIASSDTERLLSQLRSGTTDCALVEGFFDKSAWEWSVFCTERLTAVCAPDSPLAQVKEPLAIEDLLDQHVLVREQGSGTRAVLAHALAGRNLSLESFARATEIESINIIKAFAARGLGIAFVYEAAVARELAAGTLARIPLAGQPVEHDLTFIWLRGSVFADECRTFIDDLRTSARALGMLHLK